MKNLVNRLIALMIILLVQFSSVFPFFQVITPALAQEACSGVSTTASSLQSSKARVGGVALDQAAKFLADMTDITGAYYDAGKDRIVFVGKKNTTAPQFDKDDLAVAIKVIVFENKLPRFSLENNINDENLLDAIYTPKTLQDTKFGKVMFDADYQMKKYNSGRDVNGNTVTSSVPGYKSFDQMFIDNGPSAHLPGNSRWWITPEYISLKKDDANSAFIFETVKMQVRTEALDPNNDPAWNKAADDFARHQTDHFDEFANEAPSYKEVKQIGKIAAVVKWIKDSGISTDFQWARDYAPKIVSTPRNTAKFPPTIFQTSDGEFIYTNEITGGANLITPNTYSPDTAGTSNSIKTSAQLVTTTKEDIHWTFNKDGQAYEAVAVAADAFRSAGSYNTASQDMGFEIAGDLNLNFSRVYSSYSGGQQGVGRGWNIFPAQLMITNFSADPILCGSLSNPKQLGFFSQNGGWETFSFTNCTSGYVPEDPAYHSKIFHNGDGSYTVRLKDQTEFNFDNKFVLKNTKDKNGNLVNYNYDASGRLTSIADTKNHSITLSYNGQGWISEAKDWSGRTVKYTYDSQGNLLTVADPNNNITTYTYDANFKLISVKDQNGIQAVTNTYTEGAKLSTQKNAVNNTTTYTYDNVNRVVSAKDSQVPARTNVIKYDAKARVLEQTDPLLFKTFYTYGVEFAPLTIKDKNGNTITNTYDANGNLTSVTYPDTKKITYQYDSANRLTKIIDNRYGTVTKDTTNTYDAKGNLMEINEAGRLTKFTYDTTGEALTLMDPLNRVLTWTRDSFGNKLTEKDALNNIANFEYDAIGRLQKRTDADLKVVTQTYDNNGNVLTLNDGAGTTTNVYDKENRLVKKTFPDTTVSEFAYNALGTLISTKDPALNTSSYGYDTYQNLVSQTDALTKITLNQYDALNRQTQNTSPMGKVYKYEYDKNGNITKRTEANNNITLYTYDAFNRLTKITYPDTKTVTFAYDNRGNRTQMVDSLGTSTYVYDNFNRLTKATNAYGKALEYTYDNANNLKTIVYPDWAGTVTYNYDGNNRLISVVDMSSKTTTYTYNKNGTLATRLLPNSIKTTYTYDTANRVNGITHDRFGAILAKFAYTRNTLGNITSVVESGSFVATTPQTTSFVYDTLGRLTKATYPGNKIFEYTYDKMGNRLTQKLDGINITSYVYDNDYKLTQLNNLTNFTYDNNGNQTKKPSGNFNPDPTYTFDFENRLVAHVTSAGNPYDWKYDGMGNRLRQNMQTAVTRYIYDNSGPLSRLMAVSGDENFAYSFWVYGLGLIKDGDGRYHLEDASGNMRFTTSSTGSKASGANYDPFGNIRSSAGILPNFQFNEQHFDEGSGLYYLRARYYDPTTGRFISRDPVQGQLAVPQTLNPYSYAINDPINLSDPSGEQVLELLKACVVKASSLFTKGAPAAVKTPQQIGKAGEAAAPIIKNTQKIDSFTQTAGGRIPDELNVSQKVIGEVKNVQYQSLTNQLKDFNHYAQENGYTFNLYTPEKTKVSQPLQDLINSGQIHHVIINP